MVISKKNYGRVLLDLIDDEKKNWQKFYTDQDRILMAKMLEQVNHQFNANLHYLVEIRSFNIRGAGLIYREYIDSFQSEMIRAYLIPQMVSDQVENVVTIVLSAYKHFKMSSLYYPGKNDSWPAHIYVIYDNAFLRLKPKKRKKDLIELVKNPKDALYLPFTVRMLASWRLKELEPYLIAFLGKPDQTINESFAKEYSELPQEMKRELLFTAITGLKYYQNHTNRERIEALLNCDDFDIVSAAKKTIQFYKTHENDST